MAVAKNTIGNFFSRSVNDEETAVFQSRIELLFQQMPSVLGASIMVALTVSYIFYDTSNHLYSAIWLGANFLLASFRFYLTHLFKKQKFSHLSVSSWARILILMSFLAGCLWGISPYIFFITEPIIYPVSFIVIICGMSSAALPSLSAHVPVYFAFTTPNLLSLAFFLNSDNFADQNYSLVSLLIFIFYISSSLFSINILKTTTHAIRLKIKNDQLIKQLQLQKERAEDANTAKSRFLAAASHDLRQPLQAMLLFIDNLSTSNVNEQQQKSINNILHSSNALKDLFDELLNISKLDAGVVKSKPENFEIKQLIEEICQDQESLTQEKNQELHCKVQPNFVYSDPFLIKRVIQNIICNAIQYTPKRGSITISSTQKNNQEVTISIKDSGPGIPADELDDIFDEFHQLHNPERDRSKGLGLGLAIVKRLLSLLGSEIHVQSEMNKGSCFSFNLQLGHCPAPSQKISHQNLSPHDLQNKVVLIIDDEKDIRLALQDTLKRWGCHSFVADGIETAKSVIAQHKHCDLILSDFRLRDKTTGIQAITAINLMLKKNIPAILITGDTAPERIREADSSGYPLLHKPVKPAQLRLLITQVISRDLADTNTSN